MTAAVVTVLIDGPLAAGYGVAMVRVLGANLRKAGYKAAMLHDVEVQKEKAKWPASYTEPESVTAIRKRENYARRGLMVWPYLGAVLWPLALLLRLGRVLGRKAAGDYRSAWTQGYQDAAQLQKTQADLAKAELEIQALVAGDPDLDPREHQALMSEINATLPGVSLEKKEAS